MGKVKLIIKGKISEVTTIVGFSINAVISDLDDFVAYKPNKYTPAWFAALEMKVLAVNEIIFPIVLTKQLKAITLRMERNVVGLRVTMNLLEGYVVDAEDLTVKLADFGIREVRREIARGDVEKLDGCLGTLLTNITNNMTALMAADYTEEKKAALEAMKQSIFEDNSLQNAMLNERGNLVVKNMEVINDLLKDIKGIWDDGKRLYRIGNKTKMKFYTNSEILKKIRHNQLHTLIAGRIWDKEGDLTRNVKIVARPASEGKRGKTAYTNALGYYEMRGLRPVSYIITITMRDGSVYVLNADAKTGELVEVDFREKSFLSSSSLSSL